MHGLCEIVKIADICELEDTIRCRSLFHKNRVIVLSVISDAGLHSIINSINNLNSEDYLIVRSSDLKKNSKLRAFFESHETAVALNCYKLDSYSILLMIEGELKRNKIAFDKEVPSIIAGMITSDSKVVSNEIEKIALFLADSHDRRLTGKMVEELISPSTEMSLDRLFSGMVMKNQKIVSHEVNLIDKNNYMLVIRAYQNYLIRLTSVQKDLASLGIEGAMNKLKPPLFGRQRNDFIEVVRKSLLEDNIDRLQKVIQLECDTKRLPVDQTQILIQRIYESVLNVK